METDRSDAAEMPMPEFSLKMKTRRTSRVNFSPSPMMLPSFAGQGPFKPADLEIDNNNNNSNNNNNNNTVKHNRPDNWREHAMERRSSSATSKPTFAMMADNNNNNNNNNNSYSHNYNNNVDSSRESGFVPRANRPSVLNSSRGGVSFGGGGGGGLARQGSVLGSSRESGFGGKQSVDFQNKGVGFSMLDSARNQYGRQLTNRKSSQNDMQFNDDDDFAIGTSRRGTITGLHGAAGAKIAQQREKMQHQLDQINTHRAKASVVHLHADELQPKPVPNSLNHDELIESYKQAVKNYEQRILQLEQVVVDKENDLTQAAEIGQTLLVDNDTLHEALDYAEFEKTSLISQLNDLEQQLAATQDQVETAVAEKYHYQEELSNVTQRMRGLQQLVLNKQQSQDSEQSSTIAELSAQISALEEENDRLRGATIDADLKQRRALSQMNDLEIQIEQYHGENDAMRHELHHFESSLKRLQAENDVLRDQIEKLPKETIGHAIEDEIEGSREAKIIALMKITAKQLHDQHEEDMERITELELTVRELEQNNQQLLEQMTSMVQRKETRRKTRVSIAAIAESSKALQMFNETLQDNTDGDGETLGDLGEFRDYLGARQRELEAGYSGDVDPPVLEELPPPPPPALEPRGPSAELQRLREEAELAQYRTKIAQEQASQAEAETKRREAEMKMQQLALAPPTPPPLPNQLQEHEVREITMRVQRTTTMGVTLWTDDQVLHLTKSFVSRLVGATPMTIARFRSVPEPESMIEEANTSVDDVLVEASRMIGHGMALPEILNSEPENAVMASLKALAQCRKECNEFSKLLLIAFVKCVDTDPRAREFFAGRSKKLAEKMAREAPAYMEEISRILGFVSGDVVDGSIDGYMDNRMRPYEEPSPSIFSMFPCVGPRG